jgi:dolichyl-diphosphooligosaccharide--protein glycosyltransferase
LSLSLTGEFWLALALVIFVTISIRLAELPHWQNGAFLFDGEYLLATHDAYAWLAGVKGVGNYVDAPFSRLLAFLHSSLGGEVARLGFWSPILFVPLLSLPICLLCHAMRLPEGGLVFGILTTSGLGYLVRTRLGFCDTDVLTLFFPISVASCLIIWLSSLIRATWLRTDNSSGDAVSPLNAMLLAFCVGVFGKIGIFFYSSSMSVLFVTYSLAGLVGAVLARKDSREFFWAGLILMFAMTFGGWIGILLAGAWGVWCLRKPKGSAVKYQVAGMIMVGVAVFILANVHELIWALVQRVFFYAKTSAPDFGNSTTAALKLPDIAQSVREAQNLDWSSLGPRMGGNWVIFTLGIFGFGFVSWRRPALLVFLPFLALGLASVKLGNRFAMYGTVGIGMGLGLGLSEFMSMLGQSQGRRWIAQLVLACVVLWPSAVFMQEVRPVPVLPKIYAETFLELRDKTEPEALLWQWWDYGYAGQYYAERATFGDGGRQSGQWLYPLAQVHSATSPRQASQLIRYFGQAMLEDGLARTTDVRTALFSGNPVSDIQKKDVADAREFLSDLVLDDTNWPTSLSNYFIVSWENLRLASWISYYGNWDIASGTSAPGKIQQVRGEVRMDSAAGTLVVGGKSTLLDSMDVVDESGTRHFEWSNGTGMHVVVNQMSRQVFLMDAKMYRSMMVQMLLRPALDFAEEFTLVVDNSPWARAYKVTN